MTYNMRTSILSIFLDPSKEIVCDLGELDTHTEILIHKYHVCRWNSVCSVHRNGRLAGAARVDYINILAIENISASKNYSLICNV